CCLKAIWAQGARCCRLQPPHTPKCAHLGSTRSDDGVSMLSRTASSKLRCLLRRPTVTRSPGNAPGTNTALPARPAQPPPSCASESMVTMSVKRTEPARPSVLRPCLQIGAEMRLAVRRPLQQVLAHARQLRGVLPRRQPAPHQLEAQVDEIGVDDVGLAV